MLFFLKIVLKEAISLQNFETLTKAIKRVEISDCADKMSTLLAQASKEKDRALQTSLEEMVARLRYQSLQRT